MTTMASQITSLMVVYSTVYSDADRRKHQSSASLAFVWGIHRDRWIPRTKGQLRGKCFHLMTSSWKHLSYEALWYDSTGKNDTASWWCHWMEAFSALLAFWEGNSPVTGGFPSQRPVTRSLDGFFYLRLNERLSKQSGCWWFETPRVVNSYYHQ